MQAEPHGTYGLSSIMQIEEAAQPTPTDAVMQAATYETYGPPSTIQVKEVARPKPKDHEVLVRVRASSVTSGDAKMRGMRDAGMFWLPLRLLLGLAKPRNPILGMEYAGEIEAIGKSVTQFKTGDKVFGMELFGANAEYMAVPEDSAIAAKSELLTDAEAAAVPFGSIAALVFLREIARVKPGERVLVYGASGNVGLFAVQIAKYFGAQVTAVCGPRNVEMVKFLGADRVIDYTKADFTVDRNSYDIIFDTVGTTSLSRCKRALTSKGRHVFLVFGLRQLLQMLWTLGKRGKHVICGVSGTKKIDLLFIKSLIEAGQITPVIDRTYALHQVNEAHSYVDTGRKKGSVIIDVAGAAQSL
jgi:NADPH:quinone reductase-like Zn-dependent oxidoreductase